MKRELQTKTNLMKGKRRQAKNLTKKDKKKKQ
jgi:hypothetical protein